jgi:hypothetical protein
MFKSFKTIFNNCPRLIKTEAHLETLLIFGIFPSFLYNISIGVQIPDFPPLSAGAHDDDVLYENSSLSKS